LNSSLLKYPPKKSKRIKKITTFKSKFILINNLFIQALINKKKFSYKRRPFKFRKKHKRIKNVQIIIIKEKQGSNLVADKELCCVRVAVLQ